MEVLVDYDNLESAEPSLARAGLFTLFSQLVAVVGPRRNTVPERCRIRLYGGWYEKENITRKAERLIADIDRTFPMLMVWVKPTKENPDEKNKCLTQVEMAYSLEAHPGRHLFRTIRARSIDTRIECDTDYFDACQEKWCPMREVAEFLEKQKCPMDDCTVSQTDVLWKREQKLIDTMITSDLIFLASKGWPCIDLV
ncbi:MAG TPA: hypothetical protein DCQ92_10810, partial [Verrucomicrobia subdivision 3 bacterium]|nr:hypothetical protein [Limisphaerales bacterium]